MADTQDCRDTMLRRAAELLTGDQRRLFQAEVTRELCGGSERRAERRFGWRRTTITKGLRELDHGFQCVGNFVARARPRWEDKNPQFAQDVRDLVEPRSQTHPELKLERCYTNMSAGEVLELLQTQKGYQKADLPSVRTMRDILNRMNYRLKRIRKAKPLKKTPQTDAIFANVKAVKAQMKAASVTSVKAETQPVVKVEVQTPPTPVEVQPVAEVQTPPTPVEVQPVAEVQTPPTPVEVQPVVEVQTPPTPIEVQPVVEVQTPPTPVEVQPVAEVQTPPTPATTEVKPVDAEEITASQTLEISMDTKAKVNEGDYARGGKNPDRLRR